MQSINHLVTKTLQCAQSAHFVRWNRVPRPLSLIVSRLKGSRNAEQVRIHSRFSAAGNAPMRRCFTAPRATLPISVPECRLKILYAGRTSWHAENG